MPDNAEPFVEYENFIHQKKIELLELKRVVWTFFDTRHTIKDIKNLQARVRTAEVEIDMVVATILKDEKLQKETADDANAICERCEKLKDYTKEMGKELADDYDDLKRDANNNKFDVLREVTTFLAIPGAFVGLVVKGGVGHGAISADDAAKVGFLVALPVITRKQIPGAFRAAARLICETPKEIKNSFMLYYLKESAKEHGRAAIKYLGRRPKSSSPAP